MTARAAARGAPDQARAKGSTVRSTLDSVGRRLGDAGVAALLAGVDPGVRRALKGAAPTDDLPYAHVVTLWEAADRAIREAHPGGGRWAEEAGEEAIRSAGMRLYGGILRKPTPRDFLTQGVSLFQLFYAPGDMEVVAEDAEGAVLRLVGFDPRTPLFCARLTGGLREAVRQAGALEPVARHVRCALHGDAFCEWALRWQRPGPAGREAAAEGALARDG